MKFHIPFTFRSTDILRKKSRFFQTYIPYKGASRLSESLENSGIDLSRKEYIAISIKTVLYSLFIVYILSATILVLAGVASAFFWSMIISVVLSFYVFFAQMIYPQIYVTRRQRNLEKNLVSALEDILVQLNSGIPLFNVMVNISDADYGELSVEFKKAVKRINAGTPEHEVLEELSKKNKSVFFKRSLWQISNGMNAGSDMTFVVKDSIKALNEEQKIQIQNYSNQLNPLVVFYMLIAVIVPALSITFLTVLSSMADIPGNTTRMLFYALFAGATFIQIMFLGIIRSKRPSLL